MFKITSEERQFLEKRREAKAAIEVDYDVAYNILSKQRKKIFGFEIDVDKNAGIISWAKGEIVVYATPFYEKSRGIPVVIEDYANEKTILESQTFKFPKLFKDENAFLNAYFTFVGKIIRKFV